MYLPRASFRSVVALLSVVGVAAAGGGIAVAAGSGAARASHVSGTAASAPTLQQSFPALQRAPTPADAIPADLTSSLAKAGLANIDLSVSDSRLVLNEPSVGKIWLVPGSQKSCIIDQGLSGGAFYDCDVNSDLQTHPLMIGARDGFWAGVAPAGVTGLKALVAGVWESVPVNSDGGFVESGDPSSAAAGSMLSWTGSDGAVHSTPQMPSVP